MATYLQGSDVFIYLSDSSLSVGYSSIYEILYATFSGAPAIGDSVHIVITAGANTLNVTVTAATTSIADLFTLIANAIQPTVFTSDTDTPPALSIVAPVNINSSSITINILYSTIACTKSDVINLENEMMEITQISQIETEFLPTFQGRTMSIEQAAVMDVASGQISTYQLRQWAKQQTLLNFKFDMPDSTETGQCYIKSNSISGGVNTGALATFEMVITGPTTLTVS